MSLKPTKSTLKEKSESNAPKPEIVLKKNHSFLINIIYLVEKTKKKRKR